MSVDWSEDQAPAAARRPASASVARRSSAGLARLALAVCVACSAAAASCAAASVALAWSAQRRCEACEWRAGLLEARLADLRRSLGQRSPESGVPGEPHLESPDWPPEGLGGANRAKGDPGELADDVPPHVEETGGYEVGFSSRWLLSSGRRRRSRAANCHKGCKGRRGEKGGKGEAGAETGGAKGEPGSLGTKGEKGGIGPVSYHGEKGGKGEPGSPGTKGEKGGIGPVSYHGEKGGKGEPGPAGICNYCPTQQTTVGNPTARPVTVTTPQGLGATDTSVEDIHASLSAAHLEGGRESTIELDQYNWVPYWQYASWMDAEAKSKFRLSSGGNVTVRDAGIYYVYSQMMYYDPSVFMGHSIYVGDRKRFSCTMCTMEQNRKYNTCYIGGAVQIHSLQTVAIRMNYPGRTISLDPVNTHFGLIRLS